MQILQLFLKVDTVYRALAHFHVEPIPTCGWGNGGHPSPAAHGSAPGYLLLSGERTRPRWFKWQGKTPPGERERPDLAEPETELSHERWKNTLTARHRLPLPVKSGGWSPLGQPVAALRQHLPRRTATAPQGDWGSWPQATGPARRSAAAPATASSRCARLLHAPKTQGEDTTGIHPSHYRHHK